MTMQGRAGARTGGADCEVAAMQYRGTPVLRLRGHLSRAGLVQCRAAIDNAIAAGAPRLVVDLQAATFDHTSVALLGLVRRYCARRQATVVLAAVPQRVREQLRHARVHDLYRIYPTIADAVENATTPASRRERPLVAV